MTILRGDTQDEIFERGRALCLTNGDGAGGFDVENERITAPQISGIRDGFGYAYSEAVTPFCELGFQYKAPYIHRIYQLDCCQVRSLYFLAT
jgi:hypothetical protein